MHKNLYASTETLLVNIPHTFNVYFENTFIVWYRVFKYPNKSKQNNIHEINFT